MKFIPYYFILLLISTSCTSNPSLNIKSWEVIETQTLNEKIQHAYNRNLEWATKPELYIFNLFELSNLKKISYDYNADNIENPSNVEIKITRDGFLDDSVRGDIQYIKLRKSKDGIWKIKQIKKAISCWRNESFIYSSEACP